LGGQGFACASCVGKGYWTRMKIRKGKQSGSFETRVLSTTSRQVVRSRPCQSRKTSPASLPSQLQQSGQRWRNLSDARQACEGCRRAVPLRSTGKEDAKLSGCQLFVKINCAWLRSGWSGPGAAKRLKFGRTGEALVIGTRQGRITLESWLVKRRAYIVVAGLAAVQPRHPGSEQLLEIGLLTAPGGGTMRLPPLRREVSACAGSFMRCYPDAADDRRLGRRFQRYQRRCSARVGTAGR